MKERNQIEEKYTWDLSQIFKTDEEVYSTLEQIKPKLNDIKKFKGNLNTADNILKLFELEKEIGLIFEKIQTYAFLKHSENLEETKYVEMINFIDSISNEFSVESAFIEPELAKLSNKFLEELINDQRFNNHKLSIKEIIRNKPHTLSETEERLVSQVGKFSEDFSEIFDMFDAVDIKFEDVINCKNEKMPLTTSSYSLYLENKDRVLRDSSFKNFYKSFINMANTIATNYIANVKKDTVFSKIYKFDSTLDNSLFGGNIDEKVYNNLIKNVKDKTPLLHKYFSLKKDFLKLPSFEYYDMYVPLSDFEKSYKFEDSIKTIKLALEPMGKDYVSLIDKAFSERWIDVYPTKGKDTGAFEIGLYSVHPYVMLNDVGSLNSVFTLIHELGHAFHSYYSDKYQPYELAGYSIFLAEIASTTNEVFLIKYLYNKATTKDEKLYYLDKYLNMFKSTIFRQTMFSEFEDYAHKLIENNQPISKEKLTTYYGELNKKYHGSAITHCEQIEYEWLRIPHFYRSYYVYKYSTGLVSALNIAIKILNKEENALENYIKFLSSGGSDYPTNILKKTGIDLTTNEPYKVAFGEMEWALKELEKLK